MNLYKNVFLSTLITLFLLIPVYSDGTDFGSCCYDKESFDIVGGDNLADDGKYYCSSNTIYLTEAESFSCEHVVPLYAKDSSGACYGYQSTNSGESNFYYPDERKPLFASVYDTQAEQQTTINLIRNFLEFERNANFQLLEPIIWYTDINCQNQLPSTSNSIPDPTPIPTPIDPEDPGINFNGYNESNYTNTISPPFIPGDYFVPISDYPSTGINTSLFTNLNQGSCSIGSIDGLTTLDSLFDAKSSCESLVDNEQRCFYNPSKINTLFGIIDNSNSFTSLSEKNACQPLATVTSCNQYLSKDVCNENPGLDPENNYSSYHPNIANGCTWIPADTINTFASAQGVCVSNYVDSTEHNGFNEIDYSQRLNIIENPSFENDAEGWASTSSFDIVTDYSYFGLAAVKLNVGQSISQQVNAVSLQNYALSFSVMPTDIINVGNIEVNVIAIQKDELGNNIRTNTLGLKNNLFPTLRDGNLSIPLFQRAFFDLLDTDLRTHSIDLIIQNSGSQNIIVDAVNLEEISNVGFSDYKPITQVPTSGSSCSQCYVSGSYNTCTQEKSDSLGACEYMVNDPSMFYGEDFISTALGKDNQYTDESTKWQAQSLSESQVFCELYTNNNSCLDDSNSVHSTFGTGICSWDEVDGCYKNTLNFEENIPDHIEMSSLTGSSFSWEQSCDIFAPNVYLEVFGKTGNGEFQKYDGVTPLGEIYLHYQISDHTPISEACRNYDLDSRVYLQYEVEYTDNLGVSRNEERTFPITSTFERSTSLLKTEKLEKFIVLNPKESDTILPVANLDSDFNILKHKVTSLTLRFIDQSGNIASINGKSDNEYDFGSVTFDSYGPEIKLESPSNTKVSNTLSTYSLDTPSITPSESVFGFSVEDNLYVNYCDFRLVGGRNSLYNDSWLEVADFIPGKSSSFSIDLQRVILQTPPWGDHFGLQVRCYDSFNQVTINNYNNLDVSFNTDVTPLFPREFQDSYENISLGVQDLEYGFVNSLNEELYFYTNSSSMTCTQRVNGGPQISFGNSVNFPSGFIYNNQNYTQVVSGNVNFESEGRNIISLSCTSPLGSFSRDFTYIVDLSNPQLISFAVDNSSLLAYEDTDGNQYIILTGTDKKIYDTSVAFDLNSELKSANFIVTLDGTNSWINNQFGLQTYFVNQYGFTRNVNKTLFDFISPVRYSKNTSNADVFRNEFKFSLPEFNSLDTVPLVSNNFKKVENGLYNLVLNMSYYDKAGNELEVEHSIYIDNSTPRFNFSGDIGSIVDTSKLIFSNSKDPMIVVSFGSPEYREHTCSVSLNDGVSNYVPYLLGSGEYQSSFEFKLGDITGLSTDISIRNYELSMYCIDIFGESLDMGGYYLVYDAESPEISEVGFLNGNSFARFLPSTSAVLTDVEDVLEVSLNNIEPYGVICDIDFQSNTPQYYCDNSLVDSQMMFSGNGGTKLFNLFSMDSIISNTPSNLSECSTTSQFWQNPKYGETQFITLNVSCNDLAGNSDSFISEIDVTHYNNILVDVDFSYDNNQISPTVLLSTNLPSGNVLEFYEILSNGGRNSILNTTLTQITGNTWTQLNSLIDTDKLESDEGIIDIEVRLNSESITTNLLYDLVAPEIEISLNNLNTEGLLLDLSSIIELQVSEEISFLSSLELYIINLDNPRNRILLFDLENETIPSPFTDINQPATSNMLLGKNLDVSLPLLNLVSGSEYSLQVVAEDGSRNVASETLIFSVLETELLLLGATENPVVSDSYFTSESDPSLKIGLSIENEITCTSGEVYSISSSGVESSNKYSINFNQDNSFNLPTSLGFASRANTVGMDILCSSAEGVSYAKQMRLTYDDTPLMIESSSLTNSNNGFYYQNNNEIIQSSFEDSVRIDFENNEDYASCSISLISNNDYECNGDPISFSGSGNFITSLNQLIFDSNFGPAGLCFKTDASPLDLVSDIYTQLDFSVSCADVLGRGSSDSFSIPVTYTPSLLLNARGNVNSNQLFIEVDALRLDLNFYTFEVELNGITYSLNYNELSSNNGIVTYVLEGIDISDLTPDTIYSAKVTLLDSNTKISERMVSFLYDTIAPEIEFSITDYHEETTIFSPSFNFRVTALDSFSGVNFLEIKEGNTRIFFKNSTTLYIDQEYLSLNKEVSLLNPISYELKYLNPSNTDRIILNFVSEDMLGNTVSNVEEVLYSDIQKMILLNSENSFAHPKNQYWLSTIENPTLKFFLSQNVSRCLIPGMGDFENLGNGEFQLDLGDNGLKNSSISQYQIRCISDGRISPYSKSLYLVNTLPDFTLDSEFGFLISEDIGLRSFTINSVSPTFVQDISCSYSLNDGVQNVISGSSFSTQHVFSLNVSSYGSGSYPLIVSCYDLLERTHTSQYDLEITQDQQLELSNFNIFSEFASFELEGDSILESNTQYQFSFDTNKRNISCEYEILNAGFLNSIIQFFSSLFGTTAQDIFSNNPYQFNSNKFTLMEGEYEIFVLCVQNLEGGSVDYSFPIIVEDTDSAIGNLSIFYSLSS